ncbi:transposase [Actinoplanes sp. TBRC 11911]|uniref:transposase n=1 Tax=Actinoplanes sp. TBRC 11911 TaxID=2729386 RepID=UPI00145ED37D|nr:transposase [Actinoplanes sp. TBRC 11911]NMO55140.1 transposase [Actinoplanes sp. TBRC 11911]
MAAGGSTTVRSFPGSCFRERTGIPWRDLPARFGSWKTVYLRKRRWALDGTWQRIAERLRLDTEMGDPQWTLGINSSVIRAHQHAAGTRHQRPADAYFRTSALSAHPRTDVRAHLMRVPLPTISAPRVLGVDDFALSGRVYGTLLVDEDTRVLPITLREGRDAAFKMPTDCMPWPTRRSAFMPNVQRNVHAGVLAIADSLLSVTTTTGAPRTGI